MEKEKTSILSTIRIRERLAKKLGNLAFRRRFFRLRAQEEVAQQIRELRERRQFRQLDLARQAKMKQSAISRIEKAGYSAWTYKTLLRIAEALDAQLRIVFEAHEDVIARYEREFTEQTEILANLPTQNVAPSLDDLSKVVNGQGPLYAQVVTFPVIPVRGSTTYAAGTAFVPFPGLQPSPSRGFINTSSGIINPFGLPQGSLPSLLLPQPVQMQIESQTHEQEYPI